jgi:curved DNA-binding protein CbpA
VLGAVGAGAGALRARYRELAVALHPDKCRHPDAKAAFQRLVTAYGALQKYTR